MAEANEAPDLAAAREMVLAQLTRTIEMRLHRVDLPSSTIPRAAKAAAEAVLDLAVLLPPGWSLEWLKDPQERIPVAQAEPVAYPTAGRAAGLIRYHLQNADIGEADRAELAAFADALDATGEAHRSYHDLHITTDKIPRTSIFDLPHNVEVTCNRVGGWEVWDSSQIADRNNWRLLGGEFNAEPEECEEGRPIRGGLRLDVAGFVIVDSLTPKPEPGPTYRLGDVADIRFAGGERRAVFMPKYVPAGHPRQDAWVWPEGHVVASQVRDVRLVDRD